MIAFEIETATELVRLEGSRTAQVSFTVTNTSHQNLTAKARIVADGEARTDWFTVADPERPAPVDSELPFEVRISVPAGAPAGSYRFRLDVVGVEDPDEFSGQGKWTALEVRAPQRRALPWRWILVGAAAVLVVAAGTAAAWIATHPARGELTVSTSNTNFGTVQVGQGSLPSVVTVSNGGGSRMRMQAAALSGANAQDFALLADSCKDRELDVKATCTVQVAFAPKSQGAKQASLRIATEDQSVPLSFNGEARGVAALRFEPPQLLIVSRGVPRQTNLVVRNAGTGDLRIIRAQLEGPGNVFTSNLATCAGVTLGAGQSCTVTVVFNGAPGSFNARIVFTDDQPGSPHVVPISAMSVIIKS